MLKKFKRETIIIILVVVIVAVILGIVIYKIHDNKTRAELEAKINEIDYVYLYNFDGTHAGNFYFATCNHKKHSHERIKPLDITIDGEMYKGSTFSYKEIFIRTSKCGQVNGIVYFKNGTSSDFLQEMLYVSDYFEIDDYVFEIPKEKQVEHLKIQRQISDIIQSG